MVCPYSLSRPGGVQGQATGLARSLRRLGHEVAVLAPDVEDGPAAGPAGPAGAAGPAGSATAAGSARSAGRGGPPVDVDGPAGDRFDGVHGIGRSVGLRSNGSVAPVALSPAAAARVARFARDRGADVVHLHEPLAPVAGYGCLLTRPVPLLGTYHRAGASGWYRALGPVARWAGSRLDVACAVSEAAAATADAATGRPCEVLFNGVEVSRFAGAEPWPTEAPTVLFLGRHEARKGLATLLEAFAGVPGPAVLWVAGDGPETEALRRRHPPSARLRWLGVLPDDEVAGRLAGAHVLCAPSVRGESFGMVLLEGMAAGCAVVASDIPGYRAAAAGHAALVPPGDPVALREALTGILAGVARGSGAGGPEALRAAARHADGWSMDRLAARYADLYARAVAHRAGARPAHRRGIT
jgi:phosphatidyl-myo-inositol alpha-mannosyltransferase